jgi:hypothetical protein
MTLMSEEFIKSKVLTAVTVKSTFFCGVIQCNSIIH